MLLGADVVLTGVDVSLTSAVDGGQALTVNASGVTTFGGIVGGTTALTSLTTDAPGTTSLGGNITTTGAQIYNDAITLTGDVVMTGAGIALNSTVDGTAADTQSLTITDSGATVLGGAVGGTNRLLNFTINGGGTATIGIDISTAGNQTYGNAITLTGNRTFTGVDVAFNSTLDAAAAGQSLTINASGVTTFGAVGQTLAFDTMTTDDPGSVAFLGNVTTTGMQHFGDAATINAAITMSASTFWFGSTVNGLAGGENLTLLATGVGSINNILFRFEDSIGATNALGTLTIGTPLGSTPAFSTIVFANTFGGANNLPVTASVNPVQNFSINASTINVEANHKVTALGNLTINATTAVTVGDLAALGDLAVNAPTINLRMRNPANFINNLGQTVQDTGVDWVAGGDISASTPLIEMGAGGPFTIGYGGTVSGSLTGAPSRQILLTLSNFIDAGAGGNGGGFALGLDFSSQQTTSQPPIAGLSPRIEIETIATPSPVLGELAEFLRTLGIPLSGEPSLEEQLDTLVGRALYNDTANPNQFAQGGQFRVTRERLSLEVVQPVINSYRNLFSKRTEGADGTGSWTDDFVPAKTSLAKSWSKYKGTATKVDGVGFRLFLENDAADAESAATLEVLNGMQALFLQLDRIGLSEFEARRPKNFLIGKVLPTEMGAGAAARQILTEAIVGEVMTPDGQPAPGMVALIGG